MDAGEEVSCSLVVSGGDGTELFEFGEEILDQMTRLVELLIIVARQTAVRFRRDHCAFAGLRQWREHPLIGIECLIADQHVGLHRRQKVVGTHEIMRFSAGQKEADRIPKRIDQGVDLGAQAAPRPPDRLVLAGFFWAPALC